MAGEVSGLDVAAQCSRITPDQVLSICLSPMQSSSAHQLGSSEIARSPVVPQFSSGFLRKSSFGELAGFVLVWSQSSKGIDVLGVLGTVLY